MINFRRILSITPVLICFSTITFAANLPGAEINICKSYLDGLNGNTPLSDEQKKQANDALEKCLSNHPNGCSNFPDSPNCANIKSKIDLLGQAIPMPTSAPSTTLPSTKKPIQVNATTITPPPPPLPINSNGDTLHTSSTPPSNGTISTTPPTNEKKDQSEPYSYF